MFKIGEFSKISGLSVDTLRHYEKMMILVPDSIDKYTGYRYYAGDQVIKVNKILALKDAGFSLDEIADILNNNRDTSYLLEILEEKAKAFDKLLSVEYERLERLQNNIFLIKNGGIPQMNEIVIKRIEPILVASIRKKIDKDLFGEELEVMWGELDSHIEKNRCKCNIPCMMMYHVGWSEHKEYLDIEIVDSITKVFPVENSNVRIYELPAVEKMACIVHHGSFETFEKSFGALTKWIKKNGYSVNNPSREIYHKTELDTDNPGEYITEIQIPLK